MVGAGGFGETNRDPAGSRAALNGSQGHDRYAIEMRALPLIPARAPDGTMIIGALQRVANEPGVECHLDIGLVPLPSFFDRQPDES